MHTSEDRIVAEELSTAENTSEPDNTEDRLYLDPVQARVLGCLMEKEVTTPDYYPLTLNSLTTACNQKSNRDPKMELDDATVLDALAGLSKKLLVMEKGSTGRTQKFVHRAAKILHLSDQEQALLCELLNRGPQSPGELKTRCSRMAEFTDNDEVELLLTGLAERETPLAVELPKQSGKRDLRWAHLLSGEIDVEALQTSTAAAPTAVLKVSATETTQRIEALESEVAQLKAVIAEKLGVEL